MAPSSSGTAVAGPDSGESPDFLTQGERAVLPLAAEGHGTKPMASNLRIRAKPSDRHRTRLVRKLDIHDVARLTSHALEWGFAERRGQFTS